VWTLLVEVAGVHAEDVLELTATEDQKPVEALSADAADPALGVCVRVRRLDRCSHDVDAFAVEDAVEGAADFVSRSWMRKRGRGPRSSRSINRFRACWIIHKVSGLLVQATYATRRVPIETKNKTYSRRCQTVSTVNRSQARIEFPCWRRKVRQLEAARSGAGGTPARWSTFRTSVADTVIPSLRNSPTMRT
jgi:hypothetical protein